MTFSYSWHVSYAIQTITMRQSFKMTISFMTSGIKEWQAAIGNEDLQAVRLKSHFVLSMPPHTCWWNAPDTIYWTPWLQEHSRQAQTGFLSLSNYLSLLQCKAYEPNALFVFKNSYLANRFRQYSCYRQQFITTYLQSTKHCFLIAWHRWDSKNSATALSTELPKSHQDVHQYETVTALRNEQVGRCFWETPRHHNKIMLHKACVEQNAMHSCLIYA